MKKANQVPFTAVSFATIFSKTPNKFQRFTVTGKKLQNMVNMYSRYTTECLYETTYQISCKMYFIYD